MTGREAQIAALQEELLTLEDLVPKLEIDLQNKGKVLGAAKDSLQKMQEDFDSDGYGIVLMKQRIEQIKMELEKLEPEHKEEKTSGVKSDKKTGPPPEAESSGNPATKKHKSGEMDSEENSSIETEAPKVIVLKNLSQNANIRDVHELCKHYGDLVRIKFAKDGAHAHVEFACATHAKEALSLDGLKIWKTRLAVCESHYKMLQKSQNATEATWWEIDP